VWSTHRPLTHARGNTASPTRPHTHKITCRKTWKEWKNLYNNTRNNRKETRRGESLYKTTWGTVKENRKKKSREKRETDIRGTHNRKTQTNTIALTLLHISDTKRATNHAGQTWETARVNATKRAEHANATGTKHKRTQRQTFVKLLPRACAPSCSDGINSSIP